MSLVKRSELWPCYISILFSLQNTVATMTVHVVQDFDYSSQTAYYFFAVWSSGQIVGNNLTSCLIPYSTFVIKASLVVQTLALALTGPTHAIPPLGNLDREVELIVMGFGLFFMGITSATLQTLGNVESVVRAQRWAA